jgi:hypothetical protein
MIGRRKFRVEEIRHMLGPGASVVPIIGGAPELGAEAQLVKSPDIVLAPASALEEGDVGLLRALTGMVGDRVTLLVGNKAVFELENFRVEEVRVEPQMWGSSMASVEWVQWTARGVMLNGVKRRVSVG